MRRIYLDNSATSFPKAPGMAKAVFDYLEKGCVNLYRTESNEAFHTFDIIYSLRENLASLYNSDSPEAIGFTKNVTEALNWIIKGALRKGDHVIVSSNEHNAVMRPLVQMGIEFSRLDSDSHGFNDYSSIETMLKPNTKAIIINPAGNVSGAIQSLKEPATFARKHNLMFFIDAAQASPFVDINMKELDATAIAFTGHKGFLGPQGIGGMVLKKEFAKTLPPLITGGTGSESDKESVPTTLPERLSPGTENIPGLIGLAHSTQYVLDSKEELKSSAMDATRYLLESLSDIKDIEIKGASLDEERTSVVSITSKKKDIAYISRRLLEMEGIETRVGLHCAPYAHKTLGTFPTGTLRFSPGPFTTKEEIDITIDTLRNILDE